jgi:hypothetical protein
MMLNHWLGVLNAAQFHFRQAAAEAEAAAAHASAPTMIGIGIILKSDSESGLFSVENLVEGGPADKSQKFQLGDFVVEVDGNLTIHQDFDTVLSWIKGEVGTFVTIVVARCADWDLVESTSTPENPFGDGADFISIELKRDVVKKIDIYSHYSVAMSSSGPALATQQTPPASTLSGDLDALIGGTAFESVKSFVFEGCLGKSKGTGLLGMMGYQERYFTLDASFLTW